MADKKNWVPWDWTNKVQEWAVVGGSENAWSPVVEWVKDTVANVTKPSWEYKYTIDQISTSEKTEKELFAMFFKWEKQGILSTDRQVIERKKEIFKLLFDQDFVKRLEDYLFDTFSWYIEGDDLDYIELLSKEHIIEALY